MDGTRRRVWSFATNWHNPLELSCRPVGGVRGGGVAPAAWGISKLGTPLPKFAEVVLVLHAIQKKTQRTSMRDIDLATARHNELARIIAK
jgi:Phage derived protein Gp49-like (DUF891)